MGFLVATADWQAVLLLGGFFAVVLWKLFTGRIPLRGLLDGDVRDPNSPDGFSSEASAGRVQSITVTLFVALWYLLQVIQNPKEFPRLPDAMVGVLAGSQMLYLGGKARAMLSGRLRGLFK
jgi:hypothetical protein